MKADPAGVLEGTHFISGDHACTEGALAVGCRFVAGYPITPSTDIVERVAERMPELGGTFIQMEDELASAMAVLGASWGGVKAMTVTSGPGFSLMQETIGFAAMTETPCVFVDVQRGGPSSGLPTLPAQADMMQARWGSHGDYEIIALSPTSAQECFDLIIRAFNLSETWRVPVMLMMDESVAHTMERVVIPSPDSIEVTPRRYTTLPASEYLPYRPGPDMVPPIFKAGEGYRCYVTGLTHDERGYPATNAEAQEKLVGRLVHKVRKNSDRIAAFEERATDDAEVVVVAYGVTYRVALRAVQLAREKGVKAGVLKLKVVWPLPASRIRELAGRVKALVVPELNYGQVALEVERIAKGARTILVPHGGGALHRPEEIETAIIEAAHGS